MNKTRFLTSNAILLAVLTMALIAGVTFNTYITDQQLVEDSSSLSLALPMSSVDRALVRFDHAAHSHVEMHNPNALHSIMEALGDLDTALILLENNPALDEQNLLNGYVNDLRQFYRDAMRVYSGSEAYDMEKVKPLSERSHQILLSYPNLVDHQVQKELASQSKIFDTLEASTLRSFVASFITMLLALIGMAYFIQISVKNERLASHNEALARRAGALNDAKSSLLTMLSHEMRTPLNGILGLSNLVLRGDLNEDQRVMMNEVKSSAMNLTNVVTDMLDFADFATLDADPKADYVLSEYFFSQLRGDYTQIASEWGKTCDVELAEGKHEVFISDFRKLYSALYYLMSYILRSTPEEHAQLDVKIESDEMILKVDLHFLYDFDSDWKIEYLVDGKTAAENKITSEGLESTMALGLFESLEAKMQALNSEKDPSHHRLLIKIPIDTHVHWPVLYYFDMPESEVPNDLKQHLHGEDFSPTAQAQNALIIFVDHSAPSKERVEELRARAPKATLVGFSDALDRELYDYVISRQLNSK